jgi:hypothetical protein
MNPVKPPGFQDAAVASSAIAMKAPPVPRARAPEPTGLGDEGISMRTKLPKVCEYPGKAKTRSAAQQKNDIRMTFSINLFIPQMDLYGLQPKCFPDEQGAVA